jgi:hypothetical protein
MVEIINNSELEINFEGRKVKRKIKYSKLIDRKRERERERENALKSVGKQC